MSKLNKVTGDAQGRAEKSEMIRERYKEARDQAEQDGDADVRCPGRAEQECSRPEDDRSNYNIIQGTKTARQCHTIKWPVTR